MVQTVSFLSRTESVQAREISGLSRAPCTPGRRRSTVITEEFLISFSTLFNDWRWQIKNCIKTVDDLVNFLPKNDHLCEWAKINFKDASLPFSVTPYFASLMTGAANCPIFLQVVSTGKESLEDPTEMRDPLGEEQRQHVPHLVHRYPDRVLFLATDRCASYCRFCMRKRWVGQGPSPMRDQQEEAFRYIENRVQIKEIVFSGGDPLLLSTERIHDLLTRFCH